MGTYSKIVVVDRNDKLHRWEVKGDIDWIGEELAMAPFWKLNGDRVEATSYDEVAEFLGDELFAWDSDPDHYSYLIFLHMRNYTDTVIQEYSYCSGEEIGKPSHLYDYWNKYIREKLPVDIRLAIEHIEGANTRNETPANRTLGAWLDFNSRYAYSHKIKIFDNDNLVTQDINKYLDREITNIFNLQDGYLYVYLK
jgi:hypothetical protein